MVVLLVLVSAVFIFSCETGRDMWDPPPGFVVGIVYEKDTGFPVDSALISARVGADTADNLLSTEVTDTSGHYRLFAGYYGGDVYVLAERDGFTSEMQDAYLRKHDTVVVNFELESE